MDRCAAGLADGGRGKLIMFCGTGKTVVVVHVAATVVPVGGVVVVLCPTLGLVSQTLAVWSATGPAHVALAVCSDDTVAEEWTHPAELSCPVTTDPAEAAAWLHSSQQGLRVVLATHASAERVAAALRLAGLVADLTVVDEAHWTAGRAGKRIAVVHDEDAFPSRRRLYATATPRVVLPPTTSRADGEVVETVSMDDERVYGPTLFDYPASRAIAEGYLDDYRIAVIGVRRRDALYLLRALPTTSAGTGAHRETGRALRRAVIQTALARAAVTYKLRRMLVFTSRVEDSVAFASTLHHIVDALAPADRPPGPLTAGYVAGHMTASERAARLATLAEPPGSGWSVVASARCLREGVDVPQVDTAVLTTPSESSAHVIQAVGRAMRPHPDGRGVALVLVPILLPDDPDTQADEIGDAAGWSTVVQTLRALRAHDDTFASELDSARARMAQGVYADVPVPRVLVDLPEGYRGLLDHVMPRLLRSTTSSWWDGYAAAIRFHTRSGNLEMTCRHVDPEGYAVGQWVQNQQYCARAGLLSAEQRVLLDRLGFTATGAQEKAWQTLLKHCRAYLDEHGNLAVPQKYRDPRTGYRLGRQLSNQRVSLADGSRPDRAAELDALGMVWDMLEYRWWKIYLPALRQFHATHGHGRVAAVYITPGSDTIRLGDWVHKQKGYDRAGTLTPQRRAALQRLGVELPGLRHAQPPTTR